MDFFVGLGVAPARALFVSLEKIMEYRAFPAESCLSSCSMAANGPVGRGVGIGNADPTDASLTGECGV